MRSVAFILIVLLMTDIHCFLPLDIIEYDSLGDEVNSLAISEPFHYQITIVNILSATVRQISTCKHETGSVEMTCYKPQYLSRLSTMAFFVSIHNGALLIDFDGQLEIIIEPENKFITGGPDSHVDESLSSAKVKEPGRLVQIDSRETVFAFVDKMATSIRVINLEDRTIYTLCANKKRRVNFQFKENTPECRISGIISALLLVQDCLTSMLRILIGTKTTVMQAEISFKRKYLEYVIMKNLFLFLNNLLTFTLY